MERPKIAPHTLTHTGVIVQQWESERKRERKRERVRENTQHGWGEEGKYRSAEGGRGGGDEGTSGTERENEKDMT